MLSIFIFLVSAAFSQEYSKQKFNDEYEKCENGTSQFLMPCGDVATFSCVKPPSEDKCRYLDIECPSDDERKILFSEWEVCLESYLRKDYERYSCIKQQRTQCEQTVRDTYGYDALCKDNRTGECDYTSDILKALRWQSR